MFEMLESESERLFQILMKKANKKIYNHEVHKC